MKARRDAAAEKEAAVRRATEAQVLEDAGRLVAAWNERQAKRMPMLFSPTIGCALKARHWSCGSVVLPPAQRKRWTSVPWIATHGPRFSSLIPALSCRACRPHAPFAELVRLSDKSIADELRDEHARRIFGE